MEKFGFEKLIVTNFHEILILFYIDIKFVSIKPEKIIKHLNEHLNSFIALSMFHPILWHTFLKRKSSILYETSLQRLYIINKIEHI